VGDSLGKDDEEDEEEEEVSQDDASEIIEGRIRSGFGRRKASLVKSWVGDGDDMIQGTEAPSKLGSRDRAVGRGEEQVGACRCC
jgi:hypothetical protein